jgi:serine O-acetyltransferase
MWSAVVEGVHLMRVMPLLAVYRLSDQRDVIDADRSRWVGVARAEGWDLALSKGDASAVRHLLLLFRSRAFRSLFYYRIAQGRAFTARLMVKVLRPAFRGETSLYLQADRIGPGLYVAHGYSTTVVARSIGTNCRIHQNVTIGWNDRNESPSIGNDVIVYVGAVIIGNIAIGDGAVVGANAVVTRSVPAGMLAVGVPAINKPLRDSYAFHGERGHDQPGDT